MSRTEGWEKGNPLGRAEGIEIVMNQIADVLERDIGRGV